MKIDRQLNLVLTVERDDGSKVFIHAAPLSEAVFEANWLILSETYAAMVEEGRGWFLAQGPRNAARMMAKVAAEKGDDFAKTVTGGLIPEMTRMANAVMPTGAGWESIPLQDVITGKRLESGDLKEVENALAFFIVCSASMKPKELVKLLSAIFGMSSEQLTSSTLTEFVSSLPTSTTVASTGAKVQALSIPV